jgi:hypothetical protein
LISITENGKWLASVGLDDYRTIVIWDWKKGEKIASQRFLKVLIIKIYFGFFKRS